MEDRNAHLFRINCMLDFFVLLIFSVVVTSSPTTESIGAVMRKDKNLCKNIEVLYESAYTKNCTTSEYPIQTWDNKEQTFDKYFCLGVYDTAYKICHYHIEVNNETFNSNVEKFFPNFPGTPVNNKETLNTEIFKYCENNLREFTLLYSTLKSSWGSLVDRIGNPRLCQRICFDFDFNFRPLCAVFAWIKSTSVEMKKSNILAMNQKSPALDAAKISANHQPVDMETEFKASENKPEAIEPKEQSHDKTKDVSSGMPNEHTQLNTEKLNPEKSNKQETQKTLNDTSPKIVPDHNPREKGKDVSNVKVETNGEAPKAPDNVPSKEDINTKGDVKVTNVEDTEKKSEVEDINTSTLSENTQDHIVNQDDDMGDSIDVAGDIIPQTIETGNQNENLPIEQRNNVPYPIRTDGDSHFFTYFAIITVAGIICYIGYHNKQKILAIVLEGRRSRNSRGRRRPSTASYRKLDCTLEEAVTSQCNANVTHVIY